MKRFLTKLRRQVISPPVILFLVIWFSLFLLYLITAGHSATGYADSDEFLTLSYLWSVPHPSGFPLLIFITGFLMRLFSFINPALVGNLAGSLFQSLSCAALGTSVYISCTLPLTNKKNKSISASRSLFVISYIGSMIIGVSGHYWLYGSVLEAMSLTNCLVGLTVLSSILWWRNLLTHQPTRLLFLTTCLLAGISLSHIHTAVLMYPGLLMIILLNFRGLINNGSYRRVSRWFTGFAVWLIGLILPNLLLFWLNSRDQMYSWFMSPTLRGWIRLILRQDYAGYFPEQDAERSAYVAKIGLQFITSQPEIVKYFFINLSIMGIILFIIGFFYLLIYRRHLWLVSASWWFVACPIFLGYMGLPLYDPSNLELPMVVGIAYRQFLIAHWFTGFLLIWGLLAISFLLKRIPKIRFTLPILTFISFIYFIYLLFTNWSFANQRNNTWASEYAHQMLQYSKPNSVIICSSDLACYSLMYAQVVEKIRPDVTVITKNDLYMRRYLSNHPEYYGFSYHDNPFFFANLLSWNLLKRPVYLTNPTSYYIDYVGLDANPFYLIPSHYLYEVVKKVPPAVNDDGPYDLSTTLLTSPVSLKDQYRTGYKGYFASLHNTNGILFANYGNKDLAQNNYILARGLFPQYQEPLDRLSELETSSQNSRYKPGSETRIKDLMNEFDQNLKSGNLPQAYIAIRRATYFEPLDVTLRYKLAEIYIIGDYPDDARQELNHILQIDPQNLDALNLLETLKIKS